MVYTYGLVFRLKFTIYIFFICSKSFFLLINSPLCFNLREGWFVADGTKEMPESMLDRKTSSEAQTYSLSRHSAIISSHTIFGLFLLFFSTIFSLNVALLWAAGALMNQTVLKETMEGFFFFLCGIIRRLRCIPLISFSAYDETLSHNSFY